MMVISPPAPTPGGSSCRVISAEAKTKRVEDNSRISGYVELAGGELRWASVREGLLWVSRGPGDAPLWRLPLRGLNLQPSYPQGLAFRLTAAPPAAGTVAQIKLKTEVEYERWVKAVAAELMRQTRLDSVRFLDILGITGSLRRSRSAETLPPPPPDVSLVGGGGGVGAAEARSAAAPRLPPCLRYRKRADSLLPDVVRDLPPISANGRKSRSRRRDSGGSLFGAGGVGAWKERGQSLETLAPTCIVERELVERCRRSDVYVPVKEKRLLFEALLSSSSQEAFGCGGEGQERVRRARSCLDLASTGHPPVRDMARLFERRSTAPDASAPTAKPNHLLAVPSDMRYVRNEEDPGNRKQFSLPDLKTRHHSNVR